MTPQRWSRLREVFGAALETPQSERHRFLESACEGDTELRAEVERLLAGNQEPSWQSPAAMLLPVDAELAPGDTVSHYRVLERLGRGGMGIVYKAQDLKLGREVALKFLSEELSADPIALKRFEREARAASALNHLNICTIYGVEEHAGQPMIAMELVEGQMLGERIKRGALPIDEALNIAKQMAEALEAAHENGIVHRDLKPDNVKIKPDGTVKVLDFGLASVAMESPFEPGDPVNSPTLAKYATHAGVIMGTAAYMSPEQASGKPVDKRADIWSFGVVLFEMLTGEQLFRAEAISHTLADVPKGPIDFNRLPPEAPGKLRDLLKRCLELEVENRLRDIGDARIVIEELTGVSRETEELATAPRRRYLSRVVVAALLAIVGVAGWAAWWRSTRPENLPLTRLSVDLGPDALTGPNLTAAISPDGRRLVFPARTADGKQQLATRLLDQSRAALLAGTESGRDPFFSPDNQWVGFFADNKLKKVSIHGGAPVTLCNAPFDYGASWGEDGTIIAGLNARSGLARVPGAGGRPQPLTRLGKGELTHRWPQGLLGGRSVLFTAAPAGIGMENASVAAISLPSGVTKTLVTGGYFGRYVPANGKRGYLVYLHQGALFGVDFDPVRLEVQGAPVPILEDVAAGWIQGGGQFDFSAAPSGHGTWMYLEGKGTAQTWPVMWLGSSGNMEPLIATPGVYGLPRFSPDGGRLALMMSTSKGNDIYVYDLGRQTMTQLTFGGHSEMPVWTPDGKHMAFHSSSSGFGIWWIHSDGSGEPQQLLAALNNTIPISFSPDGKRLAYHEINPETGFDISTLPLDTSDPDHPKAGKPERFLGAQWDEAAPMFSPDGRWIAYRSNESGTFEVYVRPFPSGRGGKWQISNGGGIFGIWSRNGRELFIETADHRIAVMDYTANGDSFLPGKPRLWSERQIYYGAQLNLALAPDGKRFAVFPMPEVAGPEMGSVHVTFLLNFFDELRRRIPAAR